MTSTRYTIPDILRGISLISMIAYHAVWDLVNLWNINMPWYETKGAFIWQQTICWTFILLSGFCRGFGHKHLKRGLTVLAGAAVISIVTIFFMPACAIRYGVLGLIAIGMLILIPLEKPFSKLHPVVGAVIFFGLFLVTRNVPVGSLGFGRLVLTYLPTELYANTVTAFFGFPSVEFYSCDYFPLIPWLFLYVTGYFLCGVFRKYDLLKYLSAVSCKPLEFMGKHSLIIYMFHQPVIYGVLSLVFVL